MNNRQKKYRVTSHSHFIRRLILILLLLIGGFIPSCSSSAIPQAEVRASITSGQVPLKVSFINDSRNAAEFQWDFGDGSTMTTTTASEVITHEYTKVGIHTVRLTAISDEDPPQTSTAEITITVKHGPVYRVKLVPESLQLACHQTQQLTAEALDEYDNPVTEAQFVWKITDKEAGTIGTDNMFTAGTTAGSFNKAITVTATQNNHSAQATVPVIIKPGPLDRIKLYPETLELAIGQSYQFTVEVSDAYDNPIPEAPITWEVDPGLGIITSSGKLTAGTELGVFSEGVTVTANLNAYSVKATTSVTVCDTLQVLALDHPGGLHSQAEIDAIKLNIQQNLQPWKDAFDKLIVKADKSLSHVSQAVQDFYAPGYYSDPDASIAAKVLIHEDASAAYFCALAYQLDENAGRTQYADKAVELLNSWAAINERVSGYDGNEYMCTGGIGLIQAADLVWSYSGWDSADRDNFAVWVTSVFQNSADAIIGNMANWGCWGSLGLISSAYLLDDLTTVNSVINLMKGRIGYSIASDGHMPEETARGSSGIWYTYYALAPLTAAFQVALNATGEDLFHYTSPNGRNVKMALDCLFYYSQHPDEWPYYSGELTNIPSTDSWPGNLFMAMAGIYDEDEYSDWVTSSGPLYDSTWWGALHIAWYFPVLMQPSSEKA